MPWLPFRSRAGADGRATMKDVEAAYRLFFKRKPDPGGLATYRDAVARGMTLEDLRSSFLTSDEYRAIAAAEVRAVDLGGYHVCARRSELDFGRHIVETGQWEPHVRRALEALLRPGQTVVDVGANVGCIAFLAAKLVGPSGLVVGVEPNPDNLQLLYAGIVHNGYEQIQVLPFAASDGRRIFSLTGGTSNTHVTAPKHFQDVGYYTQSVRLDDVLGHLPAIDFVKIDIEGHEPRAIAGFERLLRQHQPTLLTELNPHFLRAVQGDDPLAYLEQLAGIYSRFRVLTAFDDDVSFATPREVMAYWARRNEEIAAQRRLPLGMLHFDVIATVA